MKKKFIILLSLIFFGCSNTEINRNNKEYALYLDKTYLKSLNFYNKNLILSKINNQWYYIRKDGKAMKVILDEKGKPDIFKEGLARTKINGKIGFFDKNLDIVLPPFYDYAFPFHNGISEICVGCKEIQNNNQIMLNGGEWKRIDRTGLLIEE